MILEACSISKDFHQGTQRVEVLKDLSLKISEKETLAIVGPSGSGKSTLLSLLAGLDQPTTGKVLYRGKNLSELTPTQLAHWRRNDMSMVFQQFHLFPHLNVIENVLVPLEFLGVQNADQIAMEMLCRVGLEHRREHLPSMISGGEAQRVAIARALVHKPQLVLADEPSGNLDLQTGEKVMQLFFDLVEERGSSVVLVTHNFDLAQRCKHKLVLN